MPTKELLKVDGYEYCIDKTDVEKEEVEKKDKKKSFIIQESKNLFTNNATNTWCNIINYKLLSLLHKVETPPPNTL